MDAIVIINLRSGHRKRRRSLDELIGETFADLHFDAEIRPTESPEEVAPILEEARSRSIGTVIAVGGDGTVSFVGRQLVGTGLALGVVPTGSGNGLARHLGIPLDSGAALRTIAEGERRPVDVGTVDGTPFLVTCGLGFDAEIAHRFASSTTRGLRSYFRYGAKTWLSFDPEAVRVEIDGRVIEERAFLLTFANANQYGSDARVAPAASMDDGLIEVVALRTGSLLAAPALLWRLFIGHTFDRSRHVGSYRGREIVLHRKSAGPIHIDGEPAMAGETITIGVQPRALTVVVPKGTKKI